MSNGVLPALSDNHFGITFMYKARPPKGAGIVNETKINFADTCWPCSTGRWTWSRGRSRRGSSACKDCNITKCKQDQIQPVVKRFSSEKSQKLWLCFPPWVDGHGDEGYIRVGWFLSRAECRRPGSLLAHLANLWFGEIFEGVAVVTCNLATSGLNCIWRSTRVCWYSPASVKELQPRCRNILSILPVDAGAFYEIQCEPTRATVWWQVVRERVPSCLISDSECFRENSLHLTPRHSERRETLGRSSVTH